MKYLKSFKDQEEFRSHESDMEDQIYFDGFMSKDDDECPYPYFQDLCFKRRELVTKEPFTESDRKELRELNDKIDATEWSRWNKGRSRREKIKLELSLEEISELFNEIEDDPKVISVKYDTISTKLINYYKPQEKDLNKFEEFAHSLDILTDIELDLDNDDIDYNWRKIESLEEGHLKRILLCFSGESPNLDLIRRTEFIKWIERVSNFRIFRFHGSSKKIEGSKLKFGFNLIFLKLKK